jgi:protein arginine N-methyltransferase 3
MIGLSEYGIIKLTNYIRFEAKIGNHKPNVTEEEMFSAEEYLLPALEDDAMLMNVGDVQQMVLMEYNEPPLNFGEKDGARDKLVEELEATNRNLTAQLELAKNALEQHYEDAEETYGPRTPYVGTRTRAKALKGVEDNADDHYFKSYENNGM